MTSIMLRPGRRKRLRNIVDCGCIGLIPGMNGVLSVQKCHERIAANSESVPLEEAKSDQRLELEAPTVAVDVNGKRVAIAVPAVRQQRRDGEELPLGGKVAPRHRAG